MKGNTMKGNNMKGNNMKVNIEVKDPVDWSMVSELVSCNLEDDGYKITPEKVNKLLKSSKSFERAVKKVYNKCVHKILATHGDYHADIYDDFNNECISIAKGIVLVQMEK